jgi:hypothetical protein
LLFQLALPERAKPGSNLVAKRRLEIFDPYRANVRAPSYQMF